MYDADEEDRRLRLAELEQEHRDLDSVIERVQRDSGFVDQLQLRRLKKRKLQLKDEIARLKSLLIPDRLA
jgi:hypothetical protein